jgi:AAA domain (dynein-related subfamily)
MAEEIPVTQEPQAEKQQAPVATHLEYPARYAHEQFAPPEGVEVTDFEATATGFVEIEGQYREVQQALALDFDNYASTTYGREQLESKATAQIEAMNANRQQIESGSAPIEAGSLNDRFLRHLIRPKWQDHLPTDKTEASQKAWDEFKGQYPEHIQLNLEDLRELDVKLRVLSNDENVQAEVRSLTAEKIEVMRAASVYQGAERKINGLSRRIADTYRASAISNRGMTPAERRHIDRLQSEQIELRNSRGNAITSPDMLDDVKAELRTRINIQRRRDFEHGLVLTDQMSEIIDEVLPSIVQGRPVLLVGDTGGAKTALAEYISREYLGQEPEFISGYGDVNSYQVMGKMTLRNEEGTTVSDFVPGPVIRAMEDGRPLILDEINAMPAEFLKRLNKIVQLRPGDTFVVQEDSGREVTIKSGFAIIATANEKSKRYKGVEDLSVEFQNRFGANVVRIYYPDHDVVYGQAPVDNAIIARAAMTDRSGNLVPSVSGVELEQFVRACHVTQQVFSGSLGQGFRDFVPPERIADNKPGLDEAVLAPRTMVALLEKVRDSNGKISLNQVLERFVTGIKSDNDRQQMVLILNGYGFLNDTGN